MKIIKKIFIGFIILVLFLSIGVWIYTLTLKPTYNGEIQIKGLNAETTVFFDDIGVPHIYASTNLDAYKALGYVHAQDRLWQMELMRRIAPGRLSEILGEDLLSVDMFFKGIGLEENTEKVIETMDKTSLAYEYAVVYLDGVNQYINHGSTPIEFTLLGIEKESYQLEDILNVYGYMAFSFAQAQKTDPFLQDIKDRLGNEYLEELQIKIDNSSTLIRNHKPEESTLAISIGVDEILQKIPVPAFIGSNSWVIGPEKTKQGKVLFANDPHITFAQPSVWYQAHITTPNYEMYGYHLALTPFPLLGHNRDYAYGLTMFQNDDLDFYFETENPNNPNQYLRPEGYADYEIKTKTVKVKDKEDTTFEVKYSKHGPIINDLIESVAQTKPMAMQWAYTTLDNRVLDVTYGISHSKSLEDFRKSASLLHAPGLNMMYGDAEDNIAWFAAGKLYSHRDSINTRLVLDGASGKDEIQDFIDFDDNPQAINPDWHYVYSANNQPDSINGKFYTGYYLPDDRAKRIQQLIDPKHDWSVEDMKNMILDDTSSKATENLRHVLPILKKLTLSDNEKEAYSILNNWKGDFKMDKVAPTLYCKFLNEFMKNTFKDEMKNAYDVFLTTQLQKRMINAQMTKVQSIWWDDVHTDYTENKSDIVEKSFKNAVAFLENQFGQNVSEWTWNKAISLEHGHALAAGGEILRSFFNVGTFETNGGSEVLNNQIFNIEDSGIYNVIGGPSTRRIIDFSDIENSMSILPTGQSGNVFSEFYGDQAEKFVTGQFVKMKMNKEEIQQSNNKLVLKSSY